MILLIRILKMLAGVLVALVLLVMTAFAVYRFDNYMFGWEAGLYWGRTPFVSQQFREAATNEKASMVADLIFKKYFIEKSIEQVKDELGQPTGGYYNYDTNLTYTIHSDRKTIWELVFIVNHATGNVRNILIYKRCCGITQKILKTIF